MVWLRNSWYVAGWSRDVGTEPQAVRMLGEAIVLWRTASGALAALEDRCPHRHLPLSMGRCEGERLRCAYHGMLFGADGRCVEVPSQAFVPPAARVRSYPVVEQHGWVWVWMGEGAADEALIPDIPQLGGNGFAAVGKTNRVACDYRLATDNLMDLSHVAYVHPTTIGTPEFAQSSRLTVERTPRGVKVTRLVPNVPAPPTYVKSGRLPPGKPIDRWQIIEYTAPSIVIIHVGGAEAGTGGLEGRYEHGLNLWVLNATTPETETTSNYHWASARTHALGDADADRLFFDQVGAAFEEDRRVLEAQQRVLNTRPDSWALALKADAGAIEARRVLDREIARERELMLAA